jgi:hypothetical protein
MAYVLEAVIGPVAVLSVVTRGHPQTPLTPVSRSVGMIMKSCWRYDANKPSQHTNPSWKLSRQGMG